MRRLSRSFCASRLADQEAADEIALAAADEALKLDARSQPAAEIKTRIAGYADLKKLTAAAEAGDAGAMNRLAGKYADGRQVPRDDAKALAWFRKSAEAGNSQGLVQVGKMLMLGRGIEKNETDALECFKAAAESGDRIAAYHLAKMYIGGIAVTRDAAQGVKYLGQSARAGHTPAIAELIWLYSDGIDGRRQPRSAHMA